MTEEIKKEEPKIEPSNGKDIKPEVKSEPEKPITDFKIAEIWIRSGQIDLLASPDFWENSIMSLGIMEICKDKVKTHQVSTKPENKIIPASGSMMNFARNIFKRKK